MDLHTTTASRHRPAANHPRAVYTPQTELVTSKCMKFEVTSYFSIVSREKKKEN
jgi:hypothetical protein